MLLKKNKLKNMNGEILVGDDSMHMRKQKKREIKTKLEDL